MKLKRAFAQKQVWRVQMHICKQIGGSLKASPNLAFVDSFLVEIPDNACIFKEMTR